MAECYTHMDMNNDGKVEIQEFIHFWSDSNDFWDWTEEKREIAKDKLAVSKPDKHTTYRLYDIAYIR